MKAGLCLFLLVGLLSVSSAFSGDLEPPGAPAPSMTTLDQIHSAIGSASGSGLQFLGTTIATSPAIGILSLTAQCQQEFGAGTRMCTTEEIMNSMNVPAPADWNTPAGWVRPVIAFSD